MNKLFMFFCIVMMFFVIVGCPSSDDPTPKDTTSSVVTKSDVSDVFPIAEPTTLILLGSGLVGLAVLARKRIKKESDMSHLLYDNGGRRLGIEGRQFSYNAYTPERRSGNDRRSGKDMRRKSRTSKY